MSTEAKKLPFPSGAGKGDRAGGAKPKTLRYADALADVERRIVEALPEIVDGLIARAREGDLRAATYLLDRILGKSAGAKTPPAEDRRAPYSEADFERDENDPVKSLLRGLGASEGA